MQITIIGTGDVGRTLGARFAELGHDIVFTARNLDSDNMQACLSAAGDKANKAAVTEAAAGSDVVVLATQYRDADTALKAVGEISGKIVIDTTNPLKPDLSGLTVGHETSAAEELQAAFADSKLVKCFNTTGFNIMENPPAGAIMATASNDEEAKRLVMDLAASIGFDAVDAGPLSQSRLLEPMAMLWISMAYKHGQGRDYAFSIVRPE